MVKDQLLSKKIYDASWGELIRELQYKSLWKNKLFYQIDTYYPSSQICSKCGKRKKELKDLRIREIKCDICKNEMDRDINASINILMEGLKKYIGQII